MAGFGKYVVLVAIGAMLALCTGGAIAADAPAKPAKAEVPAKAAAPAQPEAPKVMKVGDKLQQIAAQDMEGNPVDFLGLLKPGALNVIAFTNSACYSCSAESALLVSLKGKHGDKINLIGVVVDISPNSYKVLSPDIKKEFKFVHDRLFKLTPLFGFDATPATALVKNGKIMDLKTGFKPDESEAFAEYIEKNL